MAKDVEAHLRKAARTLRDLKSPGDAPHFYALLAAEVDDILRRYGGQSAIKEPECKSGGDT